MKKGRKILFILKKRTLYGDQGYSTVNSGLYNSATFVHEMLVHNGVKSSLVEVNDNNDIDREVTKYKPDTVIIEALWVVPEKFKILKKLHPNVNWIIRIHSELPFIANEGMSIEWMKEYVKLDKVYVSANSRDFIESMEPILNKDVLYLPNYYPVNSKNSHNCGAKQAGVINVGLFGAIRPMKNTLTQAIAAMIYAETYGLKLRLHINTARIEQKGESLLKNIRALFVGTKHELVEHKWHKHSEFIKIVSQMDIGLQVSLSETYNIVTADFISQNIPVVTSEEITFVNPFTTLYSTKNSLEIADKMDIALSFDFPLNFINKLLLRFDSYNAKNVWLSLFS